MSAEKVIEGIFLRPKPEDAKIIWEAVREEGLPENGEGVTELLMRLLTGEIDEKRSNFFRDNPEVTQMITEIGVKGIGALFSKLRKPQ